MNDYSLEAEEKLKKVARSTFFNRKAPLFISLFNDYSKTQEMKMKPDRIMLINVYREFFDNKSSYCLLWSARSGCLTSDKV